MLLCAQKAPVVMQAVLLAMACMLEATDGPQALQMLPGLLLVLAMLQDHAARLASDPTAPLSHCSQGAVLPEHSTACHQGSCGCLDKEHALGVELQQ